MAGNAERTYLMIKPDGVQRGLVGQIIQRFEARGYKLVRSASANAMKCATRRSLLRHLPPTPTCPPGCSWSAGASVRLDVPAAV
jgi:hypothetical protein